MSREEWRNAVLDADEYGHMAKTAFLAKAPEEKETAEIVRHVAFSMAMRLGTPGEHGDDVAAEACELLITGAIESFARDWETLKEVLGDD